MARIILLSLMLVSCCSPLIKSYSIIPDGRNSKILIYLNDLHTMSQTLFPFAKKGSESVEWLRYGKNPIQVAMKYGNKTINLSASRIYATRYNNGQLDDLVVNLIPGPPGVAAEKTRYLLKIFNLKDTCIESFLSHRNGKSAALNIYYSVRQFNGGFIRIGLQPVVGNGSSGADQKWQPAISWSDKAWPNDAWAGGVRNRGS